MIAFKIFLKVLPYLLPFIREMVLGKKSFLAALRDNKKKVFFITLIIASFGLNFLTIPRLVSMSVQYVTLEKRYKELELHANSVDSSAKHPRTNNIEQQVVVKKEPVEVIPEPAKKPTSIKVEKRKPISHPDVNQIIESFEKIHSREEKESHYPTPN